MNGVLIFEKRLVYIGLTSVGMSCRTYKKHECEGQSPHFDGAQCDTLS